MKLHFTFMKRKQIKIIALCLGLMSLCAHASPNKPNILFILVDDLGALDVGYAGSNFYETPNIDKLASSGIAFNHAYASAAICSPTRASLMTGETPASLHITNWIPGQQPLGKKLKEPKILSELPLNKVTLAEQLKSVGYKTFFAGKWHLGGKGYLPDDQGFDTNLGGGHTGQPPGGYFSPYNNPNLQDGSVGEYLPNRLTSEVINFMKSNKDESFFAYLSYYSVHTPIQPTIELKNYYTQKAKSLPKIKEGVERGAKVKLTQDNPGYAAMVSSVDENVGRLIKAVTTLGLDNNTIIIFTSDNGGLSTLEASHHVYKEGIPTSNAPLRAGKGWLYEGGIRVPLIIKSPYGLNPIIKNEPIISTDLYASVLDFAGIEDLNPAMEGISITSMLHNIDNKEERALYWHFPHYHGSGSVPSSAIKKGKWKLIYFYEENKYELYNLELDPGERNDLAELKVEKGDELLSLLHKWLKEEDASLPSIAKLQGV